MLYIVLGVVILLLVLLLPVPYAVWLIGLIAGILLIAYGVYFLISGGPARRGEPRAGRRYW